MNDDEPTTVNEPVAPVAEPVQEVVTPVEETPKPSTAERLFQSGEPEAGKNVEPVVTEEPTKVEPVAEPVVETPAEPATQEPVETPALTKEQLELARQLLSPPQQAAQPVQQQAQPMTQEQLDEQIRRYKVNQADYEAVFNSESVEDSMKALDNMFQKVAIQAVSMANVLSQEQTRQLQQQMNPYVSFADQQMEAQRQQQFYEKNQDLKPLHQVVDMMADQMRSENLRFKSDQEAFDEVAKRTRAHVESLKAAGLQPQPVQAQPVTPVTQAAAKPAMAALPTGGAGGGSSQSAQKTMSTAQKLFG